MRCSECDYFIQDGAPHPTQLFHVDGVESGHPHVRSDIEMVYDGRCDKHVMGCVCSATECPEEGVQR